MVTGLPSNLGITILVVAVVDRLFTFLRNHHGIAVGKLHHRRIVEDVLIVSCKNENLVALDWTAECPAELVLPSARVESHKRRSSSERVIP